MARHCMDARQRPPYPTAVVVACADQARREASRSSLPSTLLSVAWYNDQQCWSGTSLMRAYGSVQQHAHAL